jgi:hypothetical protein
MCPDLINKVELTRKEFNRVILGFITIRPYTIIMLLALLCTLTAKLYHAINCSQINQYPGWIVLDIAVILGIEMLMSFLSLRYKSKLVIRIVTILAGIICLWSFLNAGWLVRTGTQILPRVLLTVVRDPINACRMIGLNLVKMPITAVFLLLPGIISFSFFIYVLIYPRFPNYNRKRFFFRAGISIIICLFAVSIRPSLVRGQTSQPASLELQYNAQLKALTSFIFNHNNPPPEPTRKMPAFDQVKLTHNPQAEKYNIILIVLEGVQYKQTSLSGNTLELTPFLAGFAKEGVSFENMRSTLTHTTKALFTLLTGRYASASQDIVEAVPVDKPYAGLPTILSHQLGYRTAFFQSARGNFECRPGLVSNLGFNKFWARDDLNDPNQFIGYLGCDESAVITPIINWIKKDNSPFLVTMMCSVTHDPYVTPKWFGEQPKDEFERYRQTIAYTDKFLSSLAEELKKLGIMDNTIFCIVGDHGEAFNEHGRSGHERIAFDEALHVPFCIKAPSIEPGKKVTKPVSSIDLAPTLLALLGFNVDKAGFDGVNALGTINNDRKVYFSNWMYESQAGFVQGDFKYIYDPLHQTTCFYNLKEDPYEQERMEIPEDKQQSFIEDIERWRENTIFQYDQTYKGKKILYDHWLCRWGNRQSNAKYISQEEAQKFNNRRK